MRLSRGGLRRREIRIEKERGMTMGLRMVTDGHGTSYGSAFTQTKPLSLDKVAMEYEDILVDI